MPTTRPSESRPAAPSEAEPTLPSGSEDAPRPSSKRAGPSRGLLFAAVCVGCLALAGGYAAIAAQRAASARTGAPTSAADAASLSAIASQPHLVFLSTAVGDTYGKVSLASLGADDSPRAGTTLECERVYFAAGRGLCLGNNTIGGFLSSYSAYSFDESFTPKATFRQPGSPSRVRISPDGRYGAMTVFITGHSYADTGFSTATTLVDLESGELIGNLEEFGVTRDGARFESPDFNFWGVTFARDSNRFYATLRSGGHYYLVEGDVARRAMRVVGENVECPSLSPDNTRIAYKRQVGGSGNPAWQLYLRDLASGAERPLAAETRSVDDQVEWLDDGHILYALAEQGPPRTAATSIWVLPVDGSGPPQVFRSQGYSPAVVR